VLGGEKHLLATTSSGPATICQPLKMAVTRLIVELTESRTDQAGSLGDIPGLVDLLCNHNEAMDGLEDVGDDNNTNKTPQGIAFEDPPAPAEQAANHLPQVSQPQHNVIWSSFCYSIFRNRPSVLKKGKNALVHRQ
jgi:hypothetical protein